MHSEKPSRSDVEVALNCVGFSPRSVIRVNEHGIPIVSIQLPLSLYEGGVKVPYGAGCDLALVRSNVRRVMWKGDDNGSDQLTFIGANVIISVGKGIALPEGHDISNDNYCPLIHQGNDDGRAESIYSACISGSKFSLVSIVRTFSYMNNVAITEFLRHGQGYELALIDSAEIYEEHFPELSKAFPWDNEDRLPFPLENTRGWVVLPIEQNKG